MNFKIVFFKVLSLLLVYSVYAEGGTNLKKWNRVENLIVEEINILKKMGDLSYRDDYRIIELLSERLKVIKKHMF